MSAVLEWDILDADAPRGVRVPVITGPWCQVERSRYGMVCTRRRGHGGRHAAAGRSDNGWRLVMAVWA